MEVEAMPAPDRAKLVAELSHQARVSTMWTVLLHHAIASRSGINVTDMQCINLLQLRGPMTPGQLADAMFLTTGGAITAVIDRLEKAGMVRRHRDQEDRRRVIVEAAEEGPIAELGRRFQPVAELYEKALDGYTDEQLALLVEYTTRNNEASPEVIERVKQLG
jgi:DNA-binding MarR family transcriptional regulator